MLKATLLFSVIAIRRVSSVDSDIPFLNRFAVKRLPAESALLVIRKEPKLRFEHDRQAPISPGELIQHCYVG